MYTYKYYHYIDLPKIPEHIVGRIITDPSKYQGIEHDQSYKWSKDHNQEVNEWCQKNICSDIFFAFQMMTTNHHIHMDSGTKTKFLYLLESGGTNVVTTFYDQDKQTILDSVVLDTHRWIILKVDAYHGVTGVESGKVRFGITGKIF